MSTITESAYSDLPPLFDVSQFSTWQKLLKTMLFVVRFLSRVGKGKQLFSDFSPGHFSNKNKKFVHDWIIRSAQVGVDPPVPTYLDQNGVRRLRTRMGRMDNAEFAHPIVLGTNSGVCRLLIRHAHQWLHHSGVDATLNEFLSKYWCRFARRTVKKELRNCPKCKKDRAVKFGLPPFPPYPEKRIKPSTPFEHTGLDFLGPVLFKTDGGPHKAWILSLTCLSCRAVHLELVTALTTDEFLFAFRRFVARRGVPKSLLSDHGAQFVLTKNMFDKHDELNIDWTLIPGFSPWSGGIYERINGLTKNCFRRTLGRKILRYEELITFLSEVEATINCRPITYVSDENDGQLAIRPIDLLIPKVQMDFQEPYVGDDLFRPEPAKKLAMRWWATTRAINEFWNRWATEYLLILRERMQILHKSPRAISQESPKIGHIVMVEMDEYLRNSWPLGRIVSLKGGRSAEILMGNGRVWSRPVSKLVPLEVSPEIPGHEAPPPRELEIIPETAEFDHHPPEITNQSENGEEWESQPAREALNQEGPTLGQIRFGTRGKRVKVHHTVSATALSLPLLLCLFGLLPMAMSIPTTLSCDPKGIRVNPPPDTLTMDICCNDICSNRPYKSPFLFPMPEDLLITGLDCAVTYWSGKDNSTRDLIQCVPINPCDLIRCYICIDRVLNVQCTPTISAAIIGVLALVLAMTCGTICCLLNSCRHCCRNTRWMLRRCCRSGRNLGNRKFRYME